MAKGPTNKERIEALEVAVAELQRRPTTVATGITASNLNDRVEQEIKPLNDRIRALQAIVQGYESVLRAHKVTSQEIKKAIKSSGQQLTGDQKAIVVILLQSV
jgi:hypothetical protein